MVIGKDPRRSSYMYEYALSAGLTASGADAYLLHVTTTPSVSYVTRTEDFDCGIMISACHNPYTDNGIKIFDSLGGKADEKLIRLIEAHLSAAEAGAAALPYALGEDVGRTVDFVAGRNRYIGCLISLSKVSFRGLKIGLDCANGASFFIAKSVFDALGAMTTAIHSAPDGLNINRNCGSTHPEDLQNAFSKTSWIWRLRSTGTATDASAWTKREPSGTGTAFCTPARAISLLWTNSTRTRW